MPRETQAHPRVAEKTQPSFKVDDIVSLKRQRRTGVNLYIVREVTDDALQISGNETYHGRDSGDGFIKETIKVKKSKVEKVE